MATPASPLPSAEDIVAQIYRPGVRFDQLATQCLKAANPLAFPLPSAVEEAAFRGFEEMLGRYERRGVRSAPKPRSGHKNASGVLAGMSLLRGRGIFSIGVHLTDGSAHVLGDFDLKLLARWEGEYAARVRGNQAGVTFARALSKELKTTKKTFVKQLPAARVQALKDQTGWRPGT
jgi:hypothetical protein